MTFLLAKILVLLCLAALLGALLARWWLRRHYEDVTSEYTRLEREFRAWQQGFEAKLAARPAVDLQPLAIGLERVESSVRGIDIPRPVPTDLSPVLSAVSAIHIPVPKDIDLNPLHARLQALEGAIGAIKIPVPKDPDLAPTHQRLDSLERAIKAIQIPAPTPDLQPVQARLDGVEAAIRGIRIPAMPVIPTVDLGPVMAKLEALEARPVAVVPESQPLIRAGSRNLLTRAHYGNPDDLKHIKGVKRVMEKMLHEIGVYYFWQIAEWSPTDVAHADAQLTAFHGRIERDGWVDQASGLAARPESARRPTSL